MIDYEDASDMSTMSLFIGGPFGLIALAIACVFAYQACQNAEICAQRTCPDGQTPKLMEHSCLCITEAK